MMSAATVDERPTAAYPSTSSSLLSDFEYRTFWLSSSAWILASRALAVIVGFQLYALTKNPLVLGWLGLVEAIPAVSLVLYGGHYADQHDRRFTIIWSRGSVVVLSIMLVAVSAFENSYTVYLLLLLSFLVACARAFADPAQAAFEGQIVPRHAAVQSGVLLGGGYQAMCVTGPALAGIAYDFIGPVATYAAISLIFAYSTFANFGIERRPVPEHHQELNAIQSIREGIAYVWSNQVLIASMALDLFAVLFGGAIALLPIFATDILNVGATGFGFLNAAPAIGSVTIMLISMRYPPRHHAGRVFFAAVAGFGFAMIAFGLSENFLLSFALLVIAGMCDGISVVVRRVITRLFAPDAMRGRVSAVSTVFIGSSNELGAFESGVAASLLGTARSVWIGGLVTLAVVAFAVFKAPKLLNLDLDKAQRERDA
jgi:MFS family permease